MMKLTTSIKPRHRLFSRGWQCAKARTQLTACKDSPLLMRAKQLLHLEKLLLIPVKRLIVNADDFGLTPGINSAIAELNRAGALSSTTIMASAAHFSEAARLALAQPTLTVGCHVVLVDGAPVLPPKEIPSLLDPLRPESGRFRSKLGTFLRDLLLGRIRAEEIEAEATAQIQRVQSCGIEISHLDTHKHTHAFFRVSASLVRAAQRCGVRAMRNPLEPGWSLRATPGASQWRRFEVRGLSKMGRAFARLARENDIATTEGTIGIAATGTLDHTTLRSLLGALPDGIWELACHPGYRDGELDRVATRLRASREVERQALLQVAPALVDPAFPERQADFKLIDFRQIVTCGS